MAYQHVAAQDETAPENSDGKSHTEQLRKPHPGLFTRQFIDGWAFEIVSALFGTVLIVVLCILVRRYDGQSVPSFGSVLSTSITLNFVVSLILTFAIPALLYPVAQSISQLKWIWYARAPRPLHHLEAFDQASRGISGGLSFLWRMRARSFASLGALLALVQLIISPLAQNALLYPLENAEESYLHNATAPIATSWEEEIEQIQAKPSNSKVPYGYSQLSLEMKGAIQNGIFSGSEMIKPLEPSCFGMNCTVGPYRTLSVCSSSTNVTPSLTTSTVPGPHGKPRPKVELTKSAYIQITDTYTLPYMNMTSVGIHSESDIAWYDDLAPLDFESSIKFKHVTNPIADVFVIYENVHHQGRTQYEAVEFILEWCVQTFESTMENGKTKTRLLESHTNFTTANHYHYIQTHLPRNISDGIYAFDGNVDAAGSTYYIDPGTHFSLQRHLENLLRGTITGFIGGGEPTWYTTSDVAEAFYRPFNHLLWPAGRGWATLDALLQNVATSMSNEIRRRGGRQTSFPTTFRFRQTVVRVQWGYLVAPVVFMVFCLLFFAGTLAYQVVGARRDGKRIRTWKSSSLAMVYALDTGLRERLGGMVAVSALQSQAEAVVVGLGTAGEEDCEWNLTRTEKDADAGVEGDIRERGDSVASLQEGGLSG